MTARYSILERLRTDLIGPYHENENLESYPSDVYLTGILFPQFSQITPEEQDQQQVESGGLQEGGDVVEDEVSLSNVKRPASAGISFSVISDAGTAPKINIKVDAARYISDIEDIQGTEKSSQDNIQSTTDEENDTNRRITWKREPLKASITDLSLDFAVKDLVPEDHGIAGLRIHIRCTPWKNRLLVTVALLNTLKLVKGEGRIESEEKCFFQVSLKISEGSDQSHFHPRPLSTSAADEDAASSRLIYRDAEEYAVGHTCAADWHISDSEQVNSVQSEWLPAHVVPAMSSSGDKILSDLNREENLQSLSTKWLSEHSGNELKEALLKLPELYERWLTTQHDLKLSLSDELKIQAEIHLERAADVAHKMRESIEILASDLDLETAFRLANRAIMVQRRWSYPDEKNELIWRPFQLGFILLSLASVADGNHKDRNTADLLWFPTGGGKTEAYLGLIAFVLFLRRLRHGDNGGGVASIMRYTLRTLTIQQFQRATALICSCERIRLGEFLPDDINFAPGKTPFSIGLWVGGDSVPNKIDQAAAAIGTAEGSTPVQLSRCPCEKQSALFWRRETNPDSIKVSCLEDNCCWSRNIGNLPVCTVDEDIYRERPSLVIGTVDKFAQIVRNENTLSLFASDGLYQPPDLIIQDELHLISGPLGTLTGLYEAAIDHICSRGTIRPKIIASTATIREAKPQIRALFNRDTCLFPPPVIDASNSGFAVENPNASGRLYVGVTTAGRSAKYTLQAVSASLLQAAESDSVSDLERDPYHTLVTYFNSLRELGGALVLMQDDVNRSLEDFAARRNEEARSLKNITELTSRVTSSEINDILDDLKIPFNRAGSCDILLSSNMISVGVDIPRLGLMLVNGQPKGIAEYIQATSRVGRGNVPGLVITLYNNAKSRDRSHYETFRTWHSSLYRDVEATSVTPFSSRARDRALHAVLVALVRHLIPSLTTTPVIPEALKDDVKRLAKMISKRANDVDAEESTAVAAELDDLVTRWMHRGGLQSYWNDYQINTSLLISAEKAAELRAAGRAPGSGWPTPNSMRNVEPSSGFVLVEKLRNRIKNPDA